MFDQPEPSLSAIPLPALAAVIVDTETTGLNVRSDRIVQIGAVRLADGRVDRSASFDRLIDPGMPIPAAATAIHSIGDADVAGAAGFAEAGAAFAAWVGPSVVLGYALGFDLAMLKAERERAGLAFAPPRSLDVAHLVQLLAPSLPSTALDTVAAWLGIEIQDRHQALGDALLTAEIFLALLPKLRAKGITTLAEAERATRALSARIDDEARAGWRDPTAAIAAGGPQSIRALPRIDSFPYRHRLSAIMRAPPIVLPETATLGEALRALMTNKISSVFLAPRPGDDGHGILTERDLLRAIDGEGAGVLDRPAADYATRPLITLDGDDLVYRAISLMTTEGFRHLGVRDAAGGLIGAVSARDLLKQRAAAAITLGDHLQRATSAAELGRIWSGLAAVAGTLVQEQVDAREIAAIISGELQALTRRACAIARKDMAERGEGEPPVAYAMLVLGSGGRGESLLAMDQDNAIVFACGEPGGAADRWFEAFAKRVADMLDQAGVAYCKGGVMAMNAAWRKDVDHWRRTIAGWLEVSSPENILSADIFFDGVAVHGDLALGDQLMRDARAAARGSKPLLRALALNAAEVEPPIGWFGRFKLEDGRVDLKKAGLMPLFAAARVLALRFGLEERSTQTRLLAARDHLDHGKEAIADLVEAHRIILEAVLRQQLADLQAGIPLSNRIRPGELTGTQHQNLKWALERIPLTAGLLGTPPRL
jgi:DNA polymerase-3 subunit epsilon/CBS domain-containing protein